MNLYIAYKMRDYLDVLGVFDTHEKAKACLHRYMNQFDTFSNYVWVKDTHSYQDVNINPFKDDLVGYLISKVELNKDLHPGVK